MNKYNLIKDGDRWKSRIHIDLDNFNKASIVFYSGDNIVNIISTTSGYIYGQEVVLNSMTKFVDIEVEARRNDMDLECIISYYDISGSRQEKLNFCVSKSSGYSAPVIRSVEFLHDCDMSRNSEWSISLSVERDVTAHVKKTGNAPVFISFGEHSKNSIASDLEFILLPELEKFIIPCEAVWPREYNKVSLACFELVKSSYGIKDLLYKIPISNSIRVSDFPKKLVPDISQFTWPTGKEFSDQWVVNNNYCLPQLVEMK